MTDDATLGNRMVFDCPSCGHDYRHHLSTKPGCKACDGHRGFDHPGPCAHTMASALGARVREAAEMVIAERLSSALEHLDDLVQRWHLPSCQFEAPGADWADDLAAVLAEIRGAA